MKKILPLLFLIPLLYGADVDPRKATPDDIRIKQVARIPEPRNVTINIIFPQEGDIEEENPIYTSIKIEGYPLGTNSDFPRADEVLNYPIGQSLHVIVDDNPYFARGREIINVYDRTEDYFLDDVVIEIPHALTPGQHLLRIFPARSFGESLKGDGCLAMRSFYFKDKTPTLPVDLEGPLLTYNEPQGRYPYNPEGAILLDFYISNCELSRDGFKVRLTIDDDTTRLLTAWSPYYIYDLLPGTHTIQLELLDPENRPVPGPYNNIKRQIIIE